MNHRGESENEDIDRLGKKEGPMKKLVWTYEVLLMIYGGENDHVLPNIRVISAQ